MKINSRNFFHSIFYLLFFFTYFFPEYLLVTYPKVSVYLTCFKVFFFLIILFISILNKNLFNKNVMFSFLFFLYFVLVSYIKVNNMNEVMNICICSLSLILLFNNGVKRNKINLFRSMSIFFSIMLIINTITIVLYPNGMYIRNVTGLKDNWFLGYRNNHITYILPLYLSTIINSFLKYNYLSRKSKFISIILLILTFFTKSSTSILCMTLLTLSLLFNKQIYVYIRNLYIYVFSYIILYLSIIILRIQEIFSFLIQNILKRDLSFTGRTRIWDYMLNGIKETPFLGHGLEQSAIRYEKYKVWHAHNQILEIIYETGLIGFLLFITNLSIALKELKKYWNYEIAKSLAAFLFIFFIMCLTEVYSYWYFFYIITTICNISYLLRRHEHE